MGETTIKDIARLAGCSHTLVSQVLRGKPECRASQETRMKILRLSCELNYRPNRLARRLRGVGSGTIFILGRYCPAPEHQLVITVITEKLNAQGYQVFQAQTTSEDSTRQLIGDFTELGADGVISCYTHYIPPPDMEIPSVLISDYDAVPHELGMNQETAGEILTEHLLEHGRRKIGFMGIGAWSFGEMLRGYEKVLKKHKIPRGRLFDLHFNPNGGAEFLEAMKDEKLDAVVCQNDYIAGKLIAMLTDQGIKIPDQMAVAGGSGMSFGEFTRPALTTVMFPYRELGEEAAALIMAKLRKTEYQHPLPHMLHPELFIGESCGCQEHPRTALYTLAPPTTLKEKIQEENALRME